VIYSLHSKETVMGLTDGSGQTVESTAVTPHRMDTLLSDSFSHARICQGVNHRTRRGQNLA
jgi:hypothetical protein